MKQRYFTFDTFSFVVVLLLMKGGVSAGGDIEGGTTGGGRGLWTAFTSGLNQPPNPNVKGVSCPGIGRFALKKPDSCGKYYECNLVYGQPSSLMLCAQKQMFNRVSRTCVPKEYGTCKWCLKEGRHSDKTSKKHYIDCVGGTVGIRYRCKDGKFDDKEKQCKKTAMKNITDVMVDVVYDPPLDIIQFMKDWKDAEVEEKEEKKIVSKSIEEGFNSGSDDAEPGSDDKDNKKKGSKNNEETTDDDADDE